MLFENFTEITRVPEPARVCNLVDFLFWELQQFHSGVDNSYIRQKVIDCLVHIFFEDPTNMFLCHSA